MATKEFKKDKDNSDKKACNFCGSRQDISKSCSRCKLVFYCCVECQKADWGSHKKFCISVDERKPENQQTVDASIAISKGGGSSNHETCVICFDNVDLKEDSCVLPCSHVFHASCMEEFRAHGTAAATQGSEESSTRCPLCRDDLDSSLKSQFLKGCKIYDDLLSLTTKVCRVPEKEKAEAGANISKRFSEVHEIWTSCAKAGYLPAKNALEKIPINTQLGSSSDVECLTKYAKSGNVQAQLTLGDYYTVGVGDITKDEKKGRYWYKKASDQGHPAGQYRYAVFLLSGFGGPFDFATGQQLVHKSALQGHAAAQADLGHSYKDGNGVNQCYKTAEKWLKKAAFQGNLNSIVSLAVLYYSENKLEKSFPWMKKAAELGDGPCQFLLGYHYYLVGRGGIKQNHQTLAIEWMKKAAVQGSVEAIQILTEMRIAVPEASSPTSARFL